MFYIFFVFFRFSLVRRSLAVWMNARLKFKNLHVGGRKNGLIIWQRIEFCVCGSWNFISFRFLSRVRCFCIDRNFPMLYYSFVRRSLETVEWCSVARERIRTFVGTFYVIYYITHLKHEHDSRFVKYICSDAISKFVTIRSPKIRNSNSNEIEISSRTEIRRVCRTKLTLVSSRQRTTRLLL